MTWGLSPTTLQSEKKTEKATRRKTLTSNENERREQRHDGTHRPPATGHNPPTTTTIEHQPRTTRATTGDRIKRGFPRGTETSAVWRFLRVFLLFFCVCAVFVSPYSVLRKTLFPRVALAAGRVSPRLLVVFSCGFIKKTRFSPAAGGGPRTARKQKPRKRREQNMAKRRDPHTTERSTRRRATNGPDGHGIFSEPVMLDPARLLGTWAERRGAK